MEARAPWGRCSIVRWLAARRLVSHRFFAATALLRKVGSIHSWQFEDVHVRRQDGVLVAPASAAGVLNIARAKVATWAPRCLRCTNMTSYGVRTAAL